MNTINFDITAGLSRGSGFSAKLSEEQKSAAEEILAQYDPDSLSDDDVDAIKQQLRDAGVGPSRDLKDLLQEAGFDAEQFKPKGPDGSAGGPGGPGGPPPPPAGLSEDSLKTLASIFEAYDAENLTEDDLTEIQQKLIDAGIFGKGNVVDQQA